MPNKSGPGIRWLSVAVLLLVLAVGVLFEALLARELLKRQQRWSVHHPTIDLRLRRSDEELAPPHPKRTPYHHHRRAPLIAGDTGPAGRALA